MPSFKLLTCCMIFITTFTTTTQSIKTKLDHTTKTELAQAHYERVLTEVMCGVPRPIVVRMETAELRVLPPATIIHRCGDKSGCCDSTLERCVAKTKKKVKLYFFVKPRSAGGNKHRVRKFNFTNHTECHCVDIRDIPR
ncbi:hypothetical protein JTE90_019984 [Oedothorax gibbosus]|uniref:Platelet-derived growth factor (PDGF) family profile domain-containing protein n=1 Tax=Oedothorax gibbosus TaxID=931172 RepID=A0AAV6UG37_9ARAC|nr:hypothetical protein JTE90_019984 [Oedothorax gibbosus]